MYVLKITDDYDNISFKNCTSNEKSTDINIPTSLLTISCSLSFLCLLSLMIYTLIKHLLTDKWY